MIIRDSYPVQNYGWVIKCPRRGMGYEGVDCITLHDLLDLDPVS